MPLKLNEIRSEMQDLGEEALGPHNRCSRITGQEIVSGTDTTRAIEDLRADAMEMTNMFCETNQAEKSLSHANVTPPSAARRLGGMQTMPRYAER